MSNGINVMVMSCTVASDPEVFEFGDGGKVFQCRLIGPGQLYRDDKGSWRRRPVFIDLKVWNRGKGKLADICEELKVQRGSKLLVHGCLVDDEWTSAGGVKNKRIVLEAKEIEVLD